MNSLLLLDIALKTERRLEVKEKVLERFKYLKSWSSEEQKVKIGCKKIQEQEKLKKKDLYQSKDLHISKYPKVYKWIYGS